MIVKVKKNESDGNVSFHIFDEIKNITFLEQAHKPNDNCFDNVISSDNVSYFDYRHGSVLQKTYYKILVLEMNDGHWNYIAFDDIAWIMNNSGKTIEVIRACLPIKE